MHLLLLVPPLIRYTAGPLLGVHQLATAARAAGVTTTVIDLAGRWLARFGNPDAEAPGALVGDHDRAEHLVERATSAFAGDVNLSTPLRLECSAAEVRRASEVLGPDLRALIDESLDELHGGPPVTHVGVSVLFGGQVVAALALLRAVRRRWPRCHTAVGGPHVSATGLPASAWGADAVAGTSGAAWLGSWLDRQMAPVAVPRIPAGGTAWRGYSTRRRTFPAQLGKGCAYGLCSYCTYPAVEGAYRPGPLDELLPVVVAEARSAGCRHIAFKDSLLTLPRVDAVAAHLQGTDLRWAMTTKLAPGITTGRVARWSTAGLRTVEFGLETTTRDAQLMAKKLQPVALLERSLRAFAGSGVQVVLNVLYGIPGETMASAMEMHEWLRVDLPHRHPEVHLHLEEHMLDLERLAPLARQIGHEDRWPFASHLHWERPAWHRQMERRLGAAREELAG